MSIRLLVHAGLVVSSILASGSAMSTPAAIESMAAEGTQFRVSLTDGRVLRSPELVGAILTIHYNGARRRMRIDAVETDPGDPAKAVAPSPDVSLHTLSMQAADGTWRNICDAGPDGRRQAFPMAGQTRPDATIWPAQTNAFEIICTGGAQGKCVRFGYRPWKDGPAGVAPYDLYNACVRMVRADYSGDGKGTTRNGQPIDIYDSFGIQKPDNVPGMDLEAGWTKDGAVCVRHVRVKQNITLDALEALPVLQDRTGAVCTEEFAHAHGAVLFNRSPP